MACIAHQSRIRITNAFLFTVRKYVQPLKATQHHSYSAVGEYESEVQNVDKVEDASVIRDRPCLILWMKVFLMGTFETTYE